MTDNDQVESCDDQSESSLTSDRSTDVQTFARKKSSIKRQDIGKVHFCYLSALSQISTQARGLNFIV